VSRGLAGGALSGVYPEPGPGHSLLYGFDLFDDFHWSTSTAARPGLLDWLQSTIGSAPSWSTTTPTTTREAGIRRAATASVSATGGSLRSNDSLWPECPPIGASAAWKVQLNGVQTANQFWCGFSSTPTTAPVSASTIRFVGFYCENGGNWFGIVKNGSAGAHTAIDMGITPSAWRILGFDVIDVGGGAKGIQFWWANASDRRAVLKTLVGTPITSNIPVGFDLFVVAFGLITSDAVSKQGQIDFFSLSGRCAR
jgi:hypothetical protein